MNMKSNELLRGKKLKSFCGVVVVGVSFCLFKRGLMIEDILYCTDLKPFETNL